MNKFKKKNLKLCLISLISWEKILSFHFVKDIHEVSYISAFDSIPNIGYQPCPYFHCQGLQHLVNLLVCLLYRQILKFKKRLFSLVQFSHSAVSNSLQPHESQHAKPPCPSPTPRVYSDSCPSSQWCHPAISSSVIPFSSCPQSLPASGSFPMSQLFTWGGQTTGVSASASVFKMNTQGWSHLGWTGWISLLSKGISRVFPTPYINCSLDGQVVY